MKEFNIRSPAILIGWERHKDNNDTALIFNIKNLTKIKLKHWALIED
jgi:hypothetical protein